MVFCGQCGYQVDTPFCIKCGAKNQAATAATSSADKRDVQKDSRASRGLRKPLIVAASSITALVIVGLVAFWLFSRSAVATYYIPSTAMEPTLQVHDVLAVNKWAYNAGSMPKRGDIIVFSPPIPSPDDFIKRVIGLPGEHVNLTNGIIYINGKPLAEPYTAAKPDYQLKIANYGIQVNDGFGWHVLDPQEANIPPKSDWTSPDTIPPNCYLMLGDNRNDSEDSHVWGFAQNGGTFQSGPRAGEPAQFHGKAISIISPKSRARDL